MVEHRDRRRSSDTGGERPGLSDCRRRIEALAGGGRFRVACARTGESPVPAAGLRFPDRETAALAARLTRAYRALLRRWDPATAWCDPVVSERPAVAPTATTDGTDRRAAEAPTPGGEP